MVTLLLEVINSNSANTEFYNPAPEKYRAFPRTENGVKKAVTRMKKLALSLDCISDFRIACYEGKKEYWNNKPFIGYIERKAIMENF